MSSEVEIIRRDDASMGIFCVSCKEVVDTKKDWGPGPWQAEPDYVHFKYKGLNCIIHRGAMGVWCGYVSVPETHPAYGKDWDDPLLESIDVHGGLTYANECQHHVCHVGDDKVWWLGFDCGHAYDYMPGRRALLQQYGVPNPRPTMLPGEEYRAMPFVVDQCKSLVEQLLTFHTAPAKTSVVQTKIPRRVQ